MTLVELILSVLLLSVVVLTGISIEIGLRRTMISTDWESQLLEETAPIMAIVSKDINRGIGDITNLPYRTTVIGGDMVYGVRIDSNMNAIADGPDRWTAYRLHGNELWYYPNASDASYQIMSNRLVNFSISSPVNGTSNFSIHLRKNTAQAAGYNNPEITVNSTAQYRQLSLS
jgi:hypothetical protein